MDCLETAQLEVEALTDVGVGWTELRTLLDQIEIVLIETLYGGQFTLSTQLITLNYLVDIG